MRKVNEKNFESTIECTLLAGGPDACEGFAVMRGPPPRYGAEEPSAPGGYLKRTSADYDEELCLDPEMVVKFIQATQPKEWSKLKRQYGDKARQRFLHRVHKQIDKRGTVDVLRNGVRDRGAKIRLVYFEPPTGLNPALQRKYQANFFSVTRQLAYSGDDKAQKRRLSLDVVIFLNGIPLFTAELKNPLTGQTYEDAIRQYKRIRDPREPLFAFGRCLAHFAVDPDQVWFTTHLQGDATRFFPFNKGRGTGAGNPIPPPGKFATAYLWEKIWSKNSVLNLLEHFIHEIELFDDKGQKTGERALIFPRYHQLEAVRRMVADAREKGPGEQYLIQHSAGSGKTFTIAWLAHQLTTLHDQDDEPIFDTIVVITDRRVLDRQLQQHVREFEQVRGLVRNIRGTSQDLKEALEEGKRIVVSTLQKFPYISDEIQSLPSHNFAVIIDEAHSSQSGEMRKHLKSVLAADSLEQAAAEEGDEGEDWEDRIVREMQIRGRLPNVSNFAFTATPKRRTLEMFGTPQPDGTFKPFSLYSMRQAIEEGFIMDVLEHYTTYKAYWDLLKKAEDDPRYDRRKATKVLTHHVSLHEHAIAEKVAVMVEHFHASVAHQISGRAKAMILTRSRLHAVRYKLALDRYLRDQGYLYRALVAFSGTVKDPKDGLKYTEAGMNGFPQSRTADVFAQAKYRFLVVAEKFQTGFDEPLLAAMYVDKKLSGVRAVQSLSRLNRRHPDKQMTQILDFENEAETIQKAFEPYYETTLLAEATDPNLLYDLQQGLDDFHFYSCGDVDHLAQIWFGVRQDAEPPYHEHALIHNALQPAVDRFLDASEEEQEAFRGRLKDYVRLYAFLSQVITFRDPDLEKFYVFARLLLRRLPWKRGTLPRGILDEVELGTYRLRETHEGKIDLDRGLGVVKPQSTEGLRRAQEEELLALSEIVKLLNERFGANIPEKEGEKFITELQERLGEDEGLAASVRVNAREDARLSFEHAVNDRIQEMVDVSFRFYKLLNDEPDFADFFRDIMFDRYLDSAQAN
ncbi:MAG: DEAD/DEAH box helicase family protein [Chloroflexota bacterium]|nr:DEAD/DEAH box helicase family protein [Chloroflexota bacterium]